MVDQSLIEKIEELESPYNDSYILRRDVLKIIREHNLPHGKKCIMRLTEEQCDVAWAAIQSMGDASTREHESKNTDNLSVSGEHVQTLNTSDTLNLETILKEDLRACDVDYALANGLEEKLRKVFCSEISVNDETELQSLLASYFCKRGMDALTASGYSATAIMVLRPYLREPRREAVDVRCDEDKNREHVQENIIRYRGGINDIEG